MIHKLKFLSGELDGVEFSLCGGDTIFHVGPHRDLLDGASAQTLASSDNLFYVPDAQLSGDFLLRIGVPGNAGDVHPAAADAVVTDTDTDTDTLQRIELGQRTADAPWQLQTIACNVVHSACGLHFAVRRQDQPWARSVLDFRSDQPLLAVAQTSRARPVRRMHAIAAMLLLVGVGLAAAAWWQHRAPETQVRELVEVLTDAPMDFSVVHGSDGRLYAFSDSANGVAWGRRASKRLARHGDDYRNRHAEGERLGAVLTAANIDYVVIRLRDPQRPEVVISGNPADLPRLSMRVAGVLATHMPYALQPHYEVIDDARLVVLARAQLRAMGISSQVDTSGVRVSVSNDVFLDDAGLHAMAQQSRQFTERWGTRRISINIRLWDDLLKGRSYQYSPDQLLSLGEGRWEFSRSTAR